MNKLRAVLLSALIGAVLLGTVVGVYEFCFSGPDYDAHSTDSSVRGMWPLLAFAMTVVAAVAGAVMGAIVAAIRIARQK